MPSELRHIAVYTGYKFYHNKYDMHRSHILQLLSELYFELEIFRDLWSGKSSMEVFVQDILSNMASIQDTLGEAEDAGGGDMENSEVGDSGSYDSSPSPASPGPLRLKLRKDRTKVLTIKLPPTKRSESLEDGAKSSRSKSAVPPAATMSTLPAANFPRTPRPKRLSKPVPAPENWRPQPFHREYTTRGCITANTARHEPSPKHSPVIPFPHPSPNQPGPSHQPARRTRSNVGKPPQKRPQLPPIRTDIGTGDAPASDFGDSPTGKGKGKRRRESFEELKAENSEARKRTRRK